MHTRTEIFSLSFRRGVACGFRNLIREKGRMLSFGALLSILFLGQVLLLLVLGVQGGLHLLEERDLRLEILDTATDAQIQDLVQQVRALPYVADISYVTREQAYERQKNRDPDFVAFLQKFGVENPFPETLGIRLRQLTDYPKLIEFLHKPSFATVINATFLSNTTDQEQQVYGLIEVLHVSERLLTSIVVLVLIAIFFVIVELARRHAEERSQELHIEQLLGASRLRIFLPHCVEMIFLLGTALILSLLLGGLLLFLLPIFLPALASSGMFGSWSLSVMDLMVQLLPWLIPAEVILVVLLASFGTIFALRTHVSFRDFSRFSL